MSPWLDLLANITGINKSLDIPGHLGPIIGGANFVVGFVEAEGGGCAAEVVFWLGRGFGFAVRRGGRG